MTLPATADVVIVGGGILGLSIAWHLTRRDTRRVLLLERNAPAASATSRAAALLTRARSDRATAALVRRTYDAIAELEAELGEPLDLRRVGTLHVAGSPATLAPLEALMAAADGEAVEWLDAAEAARRVPWLAAETVLRAAFMPADGFLDPYRLADAYGRAARRRGALLRSGVTVTGLRTAAGRITGVDTDRGAVAAPLVVDAAGAWAGTLAWTARVGLPQAPVRSQYWITAPDPRLFPPDHPVTVLPDAGAYARPELGCLLFGLRGRTSFVLDPRLLPDRIDGLDLGDSDGGWETLAEGAERLARVFPAVMDTGIAHYVSGLSTYTPDGRFNLGPVPGLPGLLVASGCCGAGIAASGGIGQAVADLAAEGRTAFDLAAFDPGRLGNPAPADPALLAACAAARSGKTAG
ncbi:NAD(P)/FAD-dependent oxidoreductase [Azospirillum thermophilum]|uniref:FAD-binding oxidoreductase n=1 Tax=Azospirillum thermophilum TaxID=2202148 RepID=A0A2S2CKK5_9PROT|nr:FAD-dependent oxidoreductase [Azospirillum thermophilum]AWK84976.1 FAD-binding oxidoreductase [Azospirillum thermophilum]